MYVVIQIISAFSFGGNVYFVHLCSNSMSLFLHGGGGGGGGAQKKNIFGVRGAVI